ncbi:MAG TPA: DUF732 domain-containing protein [Mycobacterium sp.]|nr:DUF732 domain-containing protein [Mycobacterium sp.]
MIRALAVVALTPPMLLLAAPAHASDQSYLDYLNAHGFKYQNHPGATTPAGAIRFGELICQNLRRGNAPRDRFDKPISNSIDQVMIDGAQHELCPDTLSRTTPTTPAVPPTPGAPTPPEIPPPPAPEPPPPPEAPPAPEPPPPPPAPEPPPPPAPEPPPPPPAPEPPPPPPAPEAPPTPVPPPVP